MHSFLRKSNLLRAGLLGLALTVVLPEVASAKPRPGLTRRLTRLLAGPTGALTINRIYCGLNSIGNICVDSLGSSTIGGGYWPKGTADQYVFNSGLQIAGLIDPAAGFEWAGDTTGAQLFNPRGDDHGEQIQPIINSTNPDDVANWPQAAFVPLGDAGQDNFDPLLRGRVSASQGDVWFVSWEGNPGLSAGRSHPLGIMVEQRGMGWNFPSGNQDILYFVYTFYNITSRDPAAYAGIRDGMRQIAEDAGADFQRINEARFGINIPDGGYTLTSLFAAFGADMDVAQADANYSTVVVPFALGNTYEHTFAGTEEWTFDPGIFGSPFFQGAGFVGVKYLKSPVDPVTGLEVGLTLFSNTINGGAFDDASNVTQLYRYLSNNISTAAGDAACTFPAATRICYVNNGQPDDMRFFQSSGPLTLAPGAFQSIVVAYIFAAPVAAGACTSAGSCDLVPGDPTLWLSAAALSGGANPVDDVAGFLDFTDANGDGAVQQEEVVTVPGSLLGKALTAQAVFDNLFLLPFAPESPNFFLVGGDNQVTVLWQPSASETTGDPFFAISSQPMIVPEGGGDPVVNPLFDPNYRQLDVEGYRVYRGRVDAPNSLEMLAQFDYSGTFIRDFTGGVNPGTGCAPELGIQDTTITPSPTDPTVVDTALGCPVVFDSVGPGVAPTVFIDLPLVGPLIQVATSPPGSGRIALASGQAFITAADTAITGAATGCPGFARSDPDCVLRDTGIPFVFVDNTARNNLRYFYSVTAFDINSFQSGPSSLESPRNTKSITPSAQASNLQSTATLTPTVEGRGVNVSQGATLPTIDPATGRFSGKFPPADGARLQFIGQMVQTVFSGSASFGATLIGLSLGDSRNAVPITYTYETASSTGALDTVAVQVLQGAPTGETGDTNSVAASGPFPAATVNPDLAARFGVPPTFVQNGQVAQEIAVYQRVNAFGRGCHIEFSGAMFGGNCTYNGPRWFQGANETKANPAAGNVAGTGAATDFNNAGELPGVQTIQAAQAYNQHSGTYRIIEAALGGAVRAADFNVYWGAGGLVDSVVDVTHNVPVPFMPDSMGGGWGILNQANTSAAASADASTAILSLADFGCVHPFNNPAFPAGAALACPAGVAYLFSNTAVPGPIAIYSGEPVPAPATARPNPGFAMYLAGHIFSFELAPGSGVPTAGTVWTMRSYTGHVNGGVGAAGDEGPYSYTPATRSFSALGATLKLTFDATNTVAAATENDLNRVHTVPDPYYVTSAFEQTTESKIIKFVNLPADCIIRIYSSSGVLVALLEHHSAQLGGSEDWNVRNRNNQVVASGVYFYHVESGDARRVGRFTVVNFAQ